MNKNLSTHRRTLKLALFLLVSLIFMIVIALSLGENILSPVEVFHTIIEPNSSVQKEILLSLRLPRIFLSILVGALLSLCGTVMQATVQNPLADPFLLGVSSGATLGMTLYLMIGVGISAAGMSLFSFLGAFCAILLVLFFPEVSKALLLS